MKRIEKIKEKFDLLKKLDKDFEIFGAGIHRYNFNPCVTDKKIAAFEKKYEITLPEDYTDFLTVMGSGGAGPYYGIYPLQKNIGDMEPSNQFKNLKYDFPHSEAWNMKSEVLDRLDELARTATSVDDFNKYTWDKKVVKIFENLRDELSEDLEHVQEFFEDLCADVNTELYTEEYFSNELVNGSIYLANYGCALRYLIIVSGKDKGNIWFDRRGEYGGIEPVCDSTGKRMDFLSWYEEWLDQSIVEIRK
jgi:hypothetical protein